jgi:hypothetical protein
MEKNKSGPYRPSWVDRFSSWIEGFPGNRSYYYIILGLVLLAVQTGFYWYEVPVSTVNFIPGHLFLSAVIPFILAIIPAFDKWALSALQKYLPISTLEKDEQEYIEYQLSTLPALKTILASLLLLVIFLLLELVGSGPYQIEALKGLPISSTVLRMVYIICWWCFGVLIYHTIRQLSLINQIYTRHTRINLFRIKPLYGFSDLAAFTAGSLILIPYGFLLINEEVKLTDPVVLGLYTGFTGIALITFLLPQLGIHRLQQNEKDRLLDEAYQRYDSLVADLHAVMDEKDYSDLSTLNTAIGMLEKEVSTIKGISTWPWQPETVRWLFTALVLPLLMWMLQFFLGKILS